MSYCYDYPHPAVTTDVAVFAIRQGELAVLLIRRARPPYQDCWALPGGFVQIEESLEEGARRELEEETGVTDVFLEQLHAFGQPDRDPRERVITVAYYALIPSDRLATNAASDASAASWFSLRQTPALAFDHAHILSMAHARLVEKMDDPTVLLRFMPEVFTLTELQRVHEALRGHGVDKRNFRKKVLALGLIEETGEVRRDGAHRPASLYRVLCRKRVEVIE